jgi:hypothetical protein
MRVSASCPQLCKRCADRESTRMTANPDDPRPR